MTFDGNQTMRETSLPTDAVQQADAWQRPSWPRFESDEIDGSLCDLSLTENFDRLARHFPLR